MSNSIRKWIFVLIVPVLIMVILGSVSSPGHGVALQSANIDLHDTGSLQRGAKYYMSYCMGCHSLKFSRTIVWLKIWVLTQKMALVKMM